MHQVNPHQSCEQALNALHHCRRRSQYSISTYLYGGSAHKTLLSDVIRPLDAHRGPSYCPRSDPRIIISRFWPRNCFGPWGYIWPPTRRLVRPALPSCDVPPTPPRHGRRGGSELASGSSAPMYTPPSCRGRRHSLEPLAEHVAPDQTWMVYSADRRFTPSQSPR